MENKPQQLEKTEPNQPKSLEDLNCVFGEQIQKQCPVRLFLLGPTVAKYVRPNTGDPMMDKVAESMKSMFSTMNMSMSPTAGLLVNFCDICPFLHKEKEKISADMVALAQREQNAAHKKMVKETLQELLDEQH